MRTAGPRMRTNGVVYGYRLYMPFLRTVRVKCLLHMQRQWTSVLGGTLL